MSKKKPNRFFDVRFANGNKIKTIARHEKGARSVAKTISDFSHGSKITIVKEILPLK